MYIKISTVKITLIFFVVHWFRTSKENQHSRSFTIMITIFRNNTKVKNNIHHTPMYFKNEYKMINDFLKLLHTWFHNNSQSKIIIIRQHHDLELITEIYWDTTMSLWLFYNYNTYIILIVIYKNAHWVMNPPWKVSKNITPFRLI